MKSTDMYRIPSPLQKIDVSWMEQRNLQLYIKRDDLIHSAVSGNKWRKLKYTILQAKHLRKSGILTFGGAYSNHLLATAHACMTHDMESFAIVRGEELSVESNTILKQCAEWGMKFRFVSREEYRLKDDFEYKNELKDEFRSLYIVPEGGKGYLGIVGCQEILPEIEIDFDEVWVAQGTCTTSLGLAMNVKSNQIINAVPVLKGFDAVEEEKKVMKASGFDAELINDMQSNLVHHTEYHFGGYGKVTPDLVSFIADFKEQYDIQLDPVYTGKTMYALLNTFKKSDSTDKVIVFLHTGGLIAGENLL